MNPRQPNKTLSSARDSAGTREKILAAARKYFSQNSYEKVGIRDIAMDAGVDAALVSRYFGGKEKLFAAVLDGGFRIEEHLCSQLDNLGQHLVEQIMEETTDSQEFDALRVLLRATGNSLVTSLVSERFHAEFVQPLAGLLRGRDRETRAALIASYVIGLATMRHVLGSAALDANRRLVIAKVGTAIQECVG